MTFSLLVRSMGSDWIQKAKLLLQAFQVLEIRSPTFATAARYDTTIQVGFAQVRKRGVGESRQGIDLGLKRC